MESAFLFLQDFLRGCPLALSGKLLFAFLSMYENVVRIAEMFFPFRGAAYDL
jgi:hypothetical protein